MRAFCRWCGWTDAPILTVHFASGASERCLGCVDSHELWPMVDRADRRHEPGHRPWWQWWQRIRNRSL